MAFGFVGGGRPPHLLLLFYRKGPSTKDVRRVRVKSTGCANATFALNLNVNLSPRVSSANSLRIRFDYLDMSVKC